MSGIRTQSIFRLVTIIRSVDATIPSKYHIPNPCSLLGGKVDLLARDSMCCYIDCSAGNGLVVVAWGAGGVVSLDFFDRTRLRHDGGGIPGDEGDGERVEEGRPLLYPCRAASAQSACLRSTRKGVRWAPESWVSDRYHSHGKPLLDQ